MNQLPPPMPLSFVGNVAENWRLWIQQFRLYLNATGFDKKPAQVQCSTLLTVAGEEALEIFNTFDLSDELRQGEDRCRDQEVRGILYAEGECNLRAACVQDEGTRSDRRNRCLRHGIAQACKKL